MKRAIRTMGVLAIALAAWGCAAPPMVLGAGFNVAQAGSSVFAGGKLSAVWPEQMDDVASAVLETCNQLELAIISDRPRSGYRVIEAIDADRRIINVRVTSYAPRVTGMSVGVGLLGDHPFSTLFIEVMSEKLESNAAVQGVPPRIRRPAAGEH